WTAATWKIGWRHPRSGNPCAKPSNKRKEAGTVYTVPASSIYLPVSLFLVVSDDQAVAAIFPLIDNAQTVVLAAAEDEKAVIQQVHLQNGLLRAHGLDGKMLGADDLEFFLLRHFKVIIRSRRGEILTPQPLGQAGLVLQDLALNI